MKRLDILASNDRGSALVVVFEEFGVENIGPFDQLVRLLEVVPFLQYSDVHISAERGSVGTEKLKCYRSRPNVDAPSFEDLVGGPAKNLSPGIPRRNSAIVGNQPIVDTAEMLPIFCNSAALHDDWHDGIHDFYVVNVGGLYPFAVEDHGGTNGPNTVFLL